MRPTTTILSVVAALAVSATAANAQVVVSSKIDTEGGVLGNIILQVQSKPPAPLNARRAELVSIFEEVADYARQHFREEEALMVERAYPGTLAERNGKVSRFHWPTYTWTKGAYSCYRPGQWTTIAGAEGLPVGNLFFAGEHCSYDFQGYMNGGAQTGADEG